MALRTYISLIILAMLSYPLAAQTASTWNKAGDVKSKTKTAKHKIKNLKDHIQNWGLDTTYKHTFVIGGKLNTDGWSGSMYLMKRRSYSISNFLQLNFSEIKHDKQTKQQGKNSGFPQLGNASPYVFGKINNLYTLQIGFGKEALLLPAVLDGNLSVSYRFSAGFSLAMLKPYYLKLVYEDNGGTTAHLGEQKYNRSDSAWFLNVNTILGASNWNKGLDEIDYVPGAYFESAIAIMPGKNKFFIQAITLGANGAFYSKALPIMADQAIYPWQVSLFAGLAIGKRWK